MTPDMEAARDEEAALWADFKSTGSSAVREKLFSCHSAFARNIARRHHREQSHSDIELADLTQLAYAGLLEAIDRFDPQHGVPFRAFASHRISGSVRDGIARMSEVREQISWRQRVRRERLRSLSDVAAGNLQTVEATEKLAEIAVGLALGFMLEGSGLFTQGENEEGSSPSFPGTAYDSLAWKETVAQLETELSALPEREQTILRQHYLSGMNFDQLASLLAVSKGRVSQLHRAALQLLRKRLGERNRFKLRK